MSNRPKLQSSRGSRTAGDRASGGLSPLRKWLIVGLVALVAAAVAFAATRDAADQVSDADVEADLVETSAVVLSGDPLPTFDPRSADDPAVGASAPGVRGSAFDGRDVVVEPGDGRAKIVGFFAHWCQHCQRELPRIAAWLAENQLPPGVDVIAVSTAVSEDRPNYPPSAWFEREGWAATVLSDSPSNEVGNGYGLAGFPYIVAVDGQGRVVARVSGELSTSQWEALVSLAAARAG